MRRGREIAPFAFGIASNGSVTRESTLEEMRGLGLESVQISLDGATAELNAAMRKGPPRSFERALASLRMCKRVGVPVTLGMFLHPRQHRLPAGPHRPGGAGRHSRGALLRVHPPGPRSQPAGPGVHALPVPADGGLLRARGPARSRAHGRHPGLRPRLRAHRRVLPLHGGRMQPVPLRRRERVPVPLVPARGLPGRQRAFPSPGDPVATGAHARLPRPATAAPGPLRRMPGPGHVPRGLPRHHLRLYPGPHGFVPQLPAALQAPRDGQRRTVLPGHGRPPPSPPAADVEACGTPSANGTTPTRNGWTTCSNSIPSPTCYGSRPCGATCAATTAPCRGRTGCAAAR